MHVPSIFLSGPSYQLRWIKTDSENAEAFIAIFDFEVDEL